MSCLDKKLLPKARVPKSLLRSVTLFPPCEAFFSQIEINVSTGTVPIVSTHPDLAGAGAAASA